MGSRVCWEERSGSFLFFRLEKRYGLLATVNGFMALCSVVEEGCVSSLSFCFHRFRVVYFLALYAGKRLELMQFGIIYGTLIPRGLIEDFGCNSEIGELKLGFRGFNHD